MVKSLNAPLLSFFECITQMFFLQYFTVLNFEIRKTTKNIETLRNMDRNNEDVISNLNFNVKKLMELNKKLKNIEKGVHHE